MQATVLPAPVRVTPQVNDTAIQVKSGVPAFLVYRTRKLLFRAHER
jgi:hypothetical protein